MVFDHKVKLNNVVYNAGEEVPDTSKQRIDDIEIEIPFTKEPEKTEPPTRKRGRPSKRD